MKVVLKTDIAKFRKQFEESGENIFKAMPRQIFRALTLLEVAMKQNIRSDLNVRSGTLLNSIQKELDRTGTYDWAGRVGPDGNVPYAGVQNFGHKFSARFVSPRNKKALSWGSGGDRFFSKGHTIPSFTVPGVNYLENAVDDTAEKIAKELGIMIEQEFGKQ